MSQSTIITHLCGGAAINIGNDVLNPISDLGEGYSKIIFNYLDTSRANIDKIQPRGEFFLVTTKSHGKEAIDGSGGERREHAREIIANVNDYLNKHKFLRKETNEYHLVAFSSSGGSGNTLGAYIIKALMERSIPVFAVVIGDSSNAMYSINTLNVLATLNKFALDANKPLSLIYVNNNNYMSNGIAAAEKTANQILFTTLTTMSLFLSGDNEGIDNQDMINFVDQSNYTTIKVKPGLYGTHIYSKEMTLPNGATPTMARILTLPGQDFNLSATLLHYKRGIVTNANVFSCIKEDQFPLMLVNYANFFSIEEANLRKATDDYLNVANNIVSNQVQGSTNSNYDEDTGLIL